MYGYYGTGYDLGDYEGDDDMGELDGFMDLAKKEVFGIPVWAVALGIGALAFTGAGKKVLAMVGIGKKAAKKNPRRRKAKANPRRRRNGAMKMNRRRRNRRNRR